MKHFCKNRDDQNNLLDQSKPDFISGTKLGLELTAEFVK